MESSTVPPISDISGRVFILLPPQRDPIARVEREDDVVCNIGHAVASVRPFADGVVQFRAVVDVGGGGAVVGAFVVDHDLSSGNVSRLSRSPKGRFGRTFSVTAESSVGRPPVAKALSQRWAMPSTSLSWMQVPHGLPSGEVGGGWAAVRIGRKQRRRVCMHEAFMIGTQGTEESFCSTARRGCATGDNWQMTGM